MPAEATVVNMAQTPKACLIWSGIRDLSCLQEVAALGLHQRAL